MHALKQSQPVPCITAGPGTQPAQVAVSARMCSVVPTPPNVGPAYPAIPSFIHCSQCIKHQRSAPLAETWHHSSSPRGWRRGAGTCVPKFGQFGPSHCWPPACFGRLAIPPAVLCWPADNSAVQTSVKVLDVIKLHACLCQSTSSAVGLHMPVGLSWFIAQLSEPLLWVSSLVLVDITAPGALTYNSIWLYQLSWVGCTLQSSAKTAECEAFSADLLTVCYALGRNSTQHGHGAQSGSSRPRAATTKFKKPAVHVRDGCATSLAQTAGQKYPLPCPRKSNLPRVCLAGQSGPAPINPSCALLCAALSNTTHHASSKGMCGGVQSWPARMCVWAEQPQSGQTPSKALSPNPLHS